MTLGRSSSDCGSSPSTFGRPTLSCAISRWECRRITRWRRQKALRWCVSERPSSASGRTRREDHHMAGVWKKTLNYLGLVEDEEEFVEDMPEADPAPVRRMRP